MSLYISTKGIKGEHQLGFMSMALGQWALVIGMSEITEKNHEEFFERICILGVSDGPQIHRGDGKDYYISLQDVRDHIGLGTNVDNETRRHFDARMQKSLYRDIVRKAGKIAAENQESQFPQWRVEGRGDYWYIAHPGKRAKRIGPVKANGVNYYDKANAEAIRRNRAIEASSPNC